MKVFPSIIILCMSAMSPDIHAEDLFFVAIDETPCYSSGNPRQTGIIRKNETVRVNNFSGWLPGLSNDPIGADEMPSFIMAFFKGNERYLSYFVSGTLYSRGNRGMFWP